MKALSIIGLILGVICFAIGMYLQFIIAPGAAMLESATSGEGVSEMAYAVANAALDIKVTVAEVLLLASGVSLLLNIFPFIKIKNKLALVGALLSLVALVIGVIHGTHMFS